MRRRVSAPVVVEVVEVKDSADEVLAIAALQSDRMVVWMRRRLIR